MFGPFGGRFGAENRSKKGSETQLDFGPFFQSPQSGTTSCGRASAELETDRRGGVGEGLVILEDILLCGLAP